MKKIFGGKASKSDGNGALVGKTVQVGQFHVKVETLLGQGGYAEIYQVKEVNTGQTYALKHLKLAGHPEHILEVQKEAKTMAKLKGHPNILRLHAASFAGPRNNETDGFFLLDFCPATLLEVMQTRNFQLSDRMVLHVFGCVCAAVSHMHTQNPPLAHRDIKAENILQLPDGSWVVCDYGSATHRAQVYETAQEMASEEEVIRKHTTPAYRPPEMWDLLMRQPIDTKVDIWALGVLLFVLCFGRLPFQGDSKYAILTAKFDMPPGRHPHMRALIRAMLCATPTERPDIRHVLEQLAALVAVLQQPLPEAYHTTLAAALKKVGSNQVYAGAIPPAAAAAAGTSGAALQGSPSRVTPPAGPAAAAAPAPAPAAAGAGAAAAVAASGAAAASSSNSSSTYFGVKDAVLPATGKAPPSSTSSARPVSAAAAAAGGSSKVPPASEWNPSFSGASAAPGGTAAAAAAARSGSQGQPSAALPAGLPVGASRPVVAPRSSSQRSLGTVSGGSSHTANGSSSSNNVLPNTGQQQQQQQQAAQGRRTTSEEPSVVAAAAPGSQGRSSPTSGITTTSLRLGARSPRSSANEGGVGANPGSGSSSSGQRPSTAVELAMNGAASVGAAASNSKAAASGVRQPPQRQQQQEVPGQARQAVSTSFPGAPTANGVSGASTSMVGAAAAAATHTSTSSSGGGGGAGLASLGSRASGQLDSYVTPNTLQASLTQVKDSMLMELDLLRSQVRSLSDQNQAFVFRIKQLEEYVTQQKDEMGLLHRTVATLQQQMASIQGSSGPAPAQTPPAVAPTPAAAAAAAAAAGAGDGVAPSTPVEVQQAALSSDGGGNSAVDATAPGSGQRARGTFWSAYGQGP